MSTKLHITNGSILTEYLRDLNFTDPILTWQEMLCEGPTIPSINSKEFFVLRREFLKEFYQIEVDENELSTELKKLDKEDYDEIILWFEYDLFCHINMLGVINLLHQKNIRTKLSLVCSGRIKGEKSLKGLGELNQGQLLTHFKERTELTKDDMELAIALWRTYCGTDHNILKPYITKQSNFEYMGSCLKAHLQRFPYQKNGLSAIETNILKLIRDFEIKSTHHLLGYCLNYQGYYGYGDMQFGRLIKSLKPLYSVTPERIRLNKSGHEALLGQLNVSLIVDNHMIYGGVCRKDYVFSETENRLIKTEMNAN